MTKPTDLDVLATQVCMTLDKASERPDPALDQALAKARQKALQQASPKAVWQQKKSWAALGGFAMAAGFAAFMVVPSMMHSPATGSPQMADAAVFAAPNVDLELLENMDLLMEMGGTYEG